jgi:hypothetical protein
MSTKTTTALHLQRPADHRATTTRRSTDMHAHADLRLFLARAHRDADLRAAVDARRLRDARQERRGVRVRIGHTIIRLGRRLASEPSLEPAQPC